MGKGSGRRLTNQKSRFRLPGEIIETCRSDDHAFERERYWIATLMPTANISPGGVGGRVRPKPKPRRFQWEIDIERAGMRRYIARVLISKLYDGNCEKYGVSKTDLVRIREVANGPRC